MLKKIYSNALLLLTIGTATVNAQTTTVFNEGFATSAGTGYAIANGAIGTNATWSFSRSDADFGANSGTMYVSNDGSTAGNIAGWRLGYTNTANFAAPNTTTVSSNPGVVTWTFNVFMFKIIQQYKE